MKTLTNSMLCILTHLTKNQLETKRHEIAELSQYTTKVIRESYNSEVDELVAILEILHDFLKNQSSPEQPTRSTKK
ncbi:hypothetical protein [Endozoicomonas elysicola]|uniref:Uncharacterized protein n=1 Tax=Endozoicomonas elysicola TaxID=305900 RepID=A0A081KCX7_9GAMM|nr:hypothetical protein [Endozoicomonas elysicola]KEI72003.1 hypothetical protein GV64_15850 [Endozoicomonas elysicola]